jgi:hypothetical protein
MAYEPEVTEQRNNLAEENIKRVGIKQTNKNAGQQTKRRKDQKPKRKNG